MMPGEAAAPALEMRDVSCTRGDCSITGVNLAIPLHRIAVIRGEAGGGKELLLKIAGLLETADGGEMLVGGQPTRHLDEARRAELRRSHFGYLFAAPFLLPAFTVIENVVMPMFKVLDSGPAEARQRAEELLKFAGVERCEQERAGDLSLADQRRVAVARALSTAPSILLVEDVDLDGSGELPREYIALLRSACARWPLSVIATASAAWEPTSEDLVFDVNGGKVCSGTEGLPKG